MKNLKDFVTYFKYLKTRPLKLAWLIVVNIILGLGCYFLFSDIDGFNSHNPIGWLVLLCIFILIIAFAAMYQPYYEYKGKLEEEKRLQSIRDLHSLNIKANKI